MERRDDLKSGRPLRELDASTLSGIIIHPLQLQNVQRMQNLLRGLAACEDPWDSYEFQGHLFAAVREIAIYRSGCRRAQKRLRQGRRVQADAPDLPTGGDATDVATWQFEVFVAERIERQLRSVGDGLAWKAFGFDRRIISALSRNDSRGLFVESEGLPYELGRVEELWREHGRFGLLHDLTNCLRIADVTEFVGDHERLLHEVKKSGRATAAQRVRMQAVVSAVNEGGPLPGVRPDARLTLLSTKHQNDVAVLRDAIGLARSRGVQGIALSVGRALVVASLRDATMRWSDDITGSLHALESARTRAIRRARIATATHHLKGNSGDTAARSAMAVPFSVFPLDPADQADLICDFVTFETTISLDRIVESLTEQGLHVDVLLPNESRSEPEDGDVLRIVLGGRQLIVHTAAMNPLMFELLSPRAWCDGILELMTLPNPPGSPEVVLADEAASWGGRHHRQRS